MNNQQLREQYDQMNLKRVKEALLQIYITSMASSLPVGRDFDPEWVAIKEALQPFFPIGDGEPATAQSPEI